MSKAGQKEAIHHRALATNSQIFLIKYPMAHLIALESPLWPSAIITLGLSWHKVNWLVLLIATSSTTKWCYRAH